MFSSKNEIRELFLGFTGLKVLIAGDVMIDTYLRGTVDRISPEAPVPVVTLHQRENLLGGAANVALNIHSLGATPLLCSVIGNDQQGDAFLQLLGNAGIGTTGILRCADRITTTKYRIIGNKTQMLRVDEETDTDLENKQETSLLKKIGEIIQAEKPDVIILQDYNKGVLTPLVIEGTIQLALNNQIPVVVDPKKKNFLAYHHITLFKPNLKEIREGLKISVDPEVADSLRAASKLIHEGQDAQMVMITLSDRGVFISHRNNSTFNSDMIRAHLRLIADVSGAGDTVISVASLCIARKLAPDSMAVLANLAGGLVCEHVGVVPVDKESLLTEACLLLSGNK